MGYTPKFLIDNVSFKLPYRAFAISAVSAQLWAPQNAYKGPPNGDL